MTDRPIDEVVAMKSKSREFIAVEGSSYTVFRTRTTDDPRLAGAWAWAFTGALMVCVERARLAGEPFDLRTAIEDWLAAGGSSTAHPAMQ